MTFAMLSWGIAWSNAKIVSEYLSFSNLVFLRYLFSFTFLYLYFLISKKNFYRPKFKVCLNILLISVLYYIYNIFFFLGTNIGSAGMGGVFVTTTNPLVTFIIVSLIARSINLNQIMGVILGAIGGCIILDIFKNGIEALYFGSNIYFIICSLSWGIITVLSTYGQRGYDSFSYIILSYLVTTILSLFFIEPYQIINFSIYDTRFLLNFFFVSIGAMCFGTTVYMYATPRLGPIQTSVYIFTVPFIALITSFILLDEIIKFEVVIGGIFGIIAVIIVNSAKK